MSMKAWRARITGDLAVKLAACLIVGILLPFALFGYWNLRLQRQHSEQIVLEWAHRISDLMRHGTRYQMLRNDRQALYDFIRTVGNEPGVRRVRVYNEQGRISFSTDAAEVGRKIDTNSPACHPCHVDGPPEVRRFDRSRIFAHNGERVLQLIQPIENETSCSTAACHAHPPERRVLGVIGTDLSLAEVDAQLASHQWQLLLFTGLAVVLVCGISMGFVWQVVRRPVRELTSGTEKVAGGDLRHRLAVRSNDELGHLAISFNTMTADLERANAQVAEWTRTLEQRVAEKTKELESVYASLLVTEKMASLGKLAAAVAHEVNNPLFGILTYARLIRKELERPGADMTNRAGMVEQVKTIEHEIHRCGQIMRNLLAFARQAPVEQAPQDLNVLIERAVKLVRHQCEMQSVELLVSAEEHLPEVLCDGGKIQQVILVLLSNAMEAMPGGGRLEVSSASDSVEGMARVCVRDSGTGIPPEILPRLFDPFFTTKDTGQNTGLGLAIARGIVEQHGGTISVSSDTACGAEFVVMLPLRAAGQQQQAVPDQGKFASGGGSTLQAESLRHGRPDSASVATGNAMDHAGGTK
jgi:two-component system NtrC family sensor kinase